MAPDNGKRVCLGVIIGASGVQGEVRIKPYTARPEDIAAYGPVEIGEEAGFDIQISRLSSAKGAKDAVIARLKGVDDRDAAEALKGQELYLDRASLPGEEEDEYYHADLIGLAVRDLAGQGLGTIMAVHDFGAGEMLEVNLDAGGVAMIPFTREAVPEILIGEGHIIVDPPDGVLPEPKAPKDRSGGAKSGKRKIRRSGDEGDGENGDQNGDKNV